MTFCAFFMNLFLLRITELTWAGQKEDFHTGSAALNEVKELRLPLFRCYHNLINFIINVIYSSLY